MSSKVNTLAPTDGIKDPQVRAFCDSLANAWQLRNGNTGFDDKERFITKQEWDFLAKNPNIRALAGVGQEGAMANQPGEPGTGTAPVGAGGAFVIPPWIQNLVDFLQSGITLIDFDAFRQAQGEMWTTIYRITSEASGSLAGLSQEIIARTSSDTALATQLNKLWAQVGDNTALVRIEDTVKVNNIAAVAQHFLDVQAAVTDANGNVYQAASQQQFTAYVNADTGKALASYSLIVQAQAGGVKAITGMTLTAEVVPGNPAQGRSATVFLSDVFQISTPGQTKATLQPFIISGGQTRINLLYIGDYIRSDIFFQPGFGGYRDGYGWKINKDGSAEFYGLLTLSKILSGSKLIDRKSGLEMTTTAISAWCTTVTPVSAAVQSDPSLRFFGPALHNSAISPRHRIRCTEIDEGGNGVRLPTTVHFSGVADHFVSIWIRYAPGSWQRLNTSTEPSNGYGSTSCGWAGLVAVGDASQIEFGVSATDGNGNPFGGAGNPTQLRDFSLSVAMVNI